MAHDKNRNGGGELRGDESGDVREHEGSRTGEATVGGLGHGAAPAALVEAMDLNALGGEVREKVVVAVYVVTEAVEEDELGFYETSGLQYVRCQ